MGKKYPLDTIAGPLDFFESCKGEKRVYMDAEVYRQIVELLIIQESKETDPKTRKAIHGIIDQMARPVAEADIDGEDDDTIQERGGVVFIGENVRRKMIEAIGSGGAPDQSIELLRAITPKKSIINNSKLAQEIIDSFTGAGDIALRVSGARAKKEFDIIASMTMEAPNLQITGRQPYTAYDRAVLNGICSLWQAGNTAFTAAMVYRAMNGMCGSEEGGTKVSPQAVGAVTRSIEKQRVTRLTIDCTDQMKHYKGLQRAKFDAMMISVDGIEMTAQNGQRVKAYTFTNPDRPPVLYEYSRSIGQVLSVPPRLLNSSGTIRTTEEVIAIREYLIRRIEGIKGNNILRNDRITYRGIYKELGIDIDALTGNAVKDTPKRVRKNTEALLSHFVSEGFIKGFSEYKDGRTIAGVQISL